MMNRIIVLCVFCIIAACSGKQAVQQSLFDPAGSDAHLLLAIRNCDIRREGGEVRVHFTPGKGYPEVAIYPASGLWDASGYRFVRCEIENPNDAPQLVELGFGDYDLTLGATIVPPHGKKTLKAIVYRTEHPAYIDSVFPVMHGKPGGVLRGWMASTCDSISFIRLLFPEARQGDSVSIGGIWLEGDYKQLPRAALIEKYYPFVDEYGQFMYDDWPGKITSMDELKSYDSLERQDLNVNGRPEAWDAYGGWEEGPQLKATGRFRVEKYEGKWWFVDPEGRLFWSQGIDCVEFGTQTRTRITDREHYFTYLPAGGRPEAQLYSSRAEAGKEIRWMSFHALNLFRKYGESWKKISNERIHERMASWGMNTIANWSDPEIYLQRKTPYVLTSSTRKTGQIADPFAPGFREDLEASLMSRSGELGDPWCLGVFVDNELKWGVKWAAKIPEQIQAAPADQPAKVEFMKRMKSRYTTIENLNQAWGTSFEDWDGLLENREVIPAAAGDIREFMKEFTALYYSKCRDAVRNADPEMLYLGCRMDFHLYPEDTSLNYIIKIAAKYCDVVSFNRYRYTCSELIPPGGGDYPIIIGEFHFGSLETGLLQPGLRYAADPEERAEFYEFYVRSALENPYLVGTHWFQLADQAVTGRPDGENYQAGFLTVGDVPQQEIIRRARKIGDGMYRIRTGMQF